MQHVYVCMNERCRFITAQCSHAAIAIVERKGSVLQCVAVRCSVLQCAAVCCSVLQCVAACCSVLRRDAVCCSVLQHARSHTQTCPINTLTQTHTHTHTYTHTQTHTDTHTHRHQSHPTKELTAPQKKEPRTRC